MKYDIKSGVKGLIFDLDGTLANSMPIHFEGWKKACKRFGAEIDTTFLKSYSGSPGRAIADVIIRDNGLNGNVSVEDIVKVKVEEFYRLQDNIKPIKPVTDIVKKYYGELPMAVGTGGHRKAVERTLEIIDLRKYFNIIVTANDVQNFKPHPETFLKCADLMNIDPKYIEVFEDGDLGLEAALTAGMIATDVRSWYNSDW